MFGFCGGAIEGNDLERGCMISPTLILFILFLSPHSPLTRLITSDVITRIATNGEPYPKQKQHLPVQSRQMSLTTPCGAVTIAVRSFPLASCSAGETLSSTCEWCKLHLTIDTLLLISPETDFGYLNSHHIEDPAQTRDYIKDPNGFYAGLPEMKLCSPREL